MMRAEHWQSWRAPRNAGCWYLPSMPVVWKTPQTTIVACSARQRLGSLWQGTADQIPTLCLMRLLCTTLDAPHAMRMQSRCKERRRACLRRWPPSDSNLLHLVRDTLQCVWIAGCPCMSCAPVLVRESFCCSPELRGLAVCFAGSFFGKCICNGLKGQPECPTWAWG